MPKSNEPLFLKAKRVEVEFAVDEAMEKSVVFVSPLLACIASLVHGEVVPIPRKPAEVMVVVPVPPAERPPKKLSAVEVAFEGKRYAKVLVE